MSAPSPSHPTGRLAVVTVTDAAFALGTAVLLSSFLRHNPWFEGDLIGITARPTPALRRRFAALPRFELRAPSPALERQLTLLEARMPALGRRRTRFYSLDCFGLTGYTQVLFLDSDTVCLRDLSPLFEMDAAFVACPDRSFYRGQARDPRSFRVVPGTDQENASPTFNAGMLRIGPSLLREEVHTALLQRVTPATFAAVASGHTDQVVLNQHLGSIATMASGLYNFLVPDAALIEAQTGIAPSDAALLHFAGPVKPWAIRAHLRDAIRGRRPSPYWHQWAEGLAIYRRQSPAYRDGARAVVRNSGVRLLRYVARPPARAA